MFRWSSFVFVRSASSWCWNWFWSNVRIVAAGICTIQGSRSSSLVVVGGSTGKVLCVRSAMMVSVSLGFGAMESVEISHL